MKPPDPNTLLKLAGGSIDPRWIAAIVVVVPIVAALIVWWRKRQADAKKTAAAPPPTAATALAPEAKKAPAMAEAWKVFVKDLPSNYRRSILNFEHFVVMGDAVHDEPRVADVYTDWHRLEKQFIRSKPDNQDLPLFLGSRAVLMVLPVKVLDMKEQSCKDALTKLWKPLYERKTPMVVVVMNAQKIVDLHRNNRLDEVQEMAENIRAKINLLASIRGQSLEVRILLTKLDTFLAKEDISKGHSTNGYNEVAKFCHGNGIALRVSLAGGTTADVALSAWFESIRTQLPRMLTTMETGAYGQVLRFLRASEQMLVPVRHFCTALFNPDTMFPNPIRGDLFLASASVGLANPFAQGDRTPGPNPRLPHQIAAAATAGVGLVFLGGTFLHQRTQWTDANSALDRYRPDHPIRETEQRDRAKIIAFTQEHSSFFDTFPNFFATPRIEMRERFTDTIRDQLLVPQLREVARTGKAIPDHMPLPHTRSLYFLGLIHSDKSDPLSILNEPGKDRNPRLDLWSSMTAIEPELLTDYLLNTDKAHRSAVEVGLENAPVDKFDYPQPWLKFVMDVYDAMHKGDGVVSLEELSTLRETAINLDPQVDRLENAQVTLEILSALEHAGHAPHADGTTTDSSTSSSDRQPSDGLVRAYDPAYKEYLEHYEAFRSLDVLELRSMLDTIREAGLSVEDERGLLVRLVTRLKWYYRSRTTPEDTGNLIAIGNEAHFFDKLDWIERMRDSKVHLLITSFTQNGMDRDIFFNERNEPPLILWNAAGRGAAVFEGRVALEGKYTRDAYDVHVRRPVLELAEIFDNSTIPEQDRLLLKGYVTRAVERYAQGLHGNVVAFIRGFTLKVSTPEELRVALTQMSSDAGGTTFDEFLSIVDTNTRLNEKNGQTAAEEPMLVPARDAMKDFDAWHGVASQDKGAPKIIEYKKILQQLLIDLGGTVQGGGGSGKEGVQPASMVQEEGDAKKGGPTLESDLTPSGRVYLSSILDSKGAYSGMVRSWISGTNLPKEQQWPFQLPLSYVESTGRRDIETTIDRALERELMADLEQVVNRFPFEKNAREDVTPAELTKLFHPKEGRVFDYFRRYLEPLSVFGEGGFRPKSSIGGVRISKSIYDFLNAATLLSSRLWDENGAPRPLEYPFVTVPFGKAPNDETALTLVYLNVGSGSLFNFNQQQSGKVLPLEWTKTASSQVGVQLTNTETKDNVFPPPINRSGSYYSLLRLLMAAEQPPGAVKEPATAQLYSWDITVQQKEKVRIQFVIKKDPWETFSLRPYVLKMVNR